MSSEVTEVRGGVVILVLAEIVLVVECRMYYVQ